MKIAALVWNDEQMRHIPKDLKDITVVVFSFEYEDGRYNKQIHIEARKLGDEEIIKVRSIHGILSITPESANVIRVSTTDF